MVKVKGKVNGKRRATLTGFKWMSSGEITDQQYRIDYSNIYTNYSGK
jgi:hypothetical protein